MNVLLVGLGSMGKNHLRILQSDSRIKNIEVLDLFLNVAIPGVETHHKQDTLKKKYDAVFISSPTDSHLEVFRSLAKISNHFFIEKPIESTLERAEKLYELARNKNKYIFVGHIERFNPIVQVIKVVISENKIGKLYSIRCERLGMSPSRDGSIDISLDLLIHDIDICNYLLEAMPDFGDVYEKSLVGGSRGDHAHIQLYYGEVYASLYANWCTPIKRRTIEIIGSQGMCTIDLMAQSGCLSYKDLITGFEVEEKLNIKFVEPLKVQLDEFLNNVETRNMQSPNFGFNAVKTYFKLVDINV